MNEQLDLGKYQGKKLIAFDLYGTCIDHPNKDIRIPLELKDILMKQAITLKEIEEKGQDFWDNFRINDVIESIRNDIKWTFLLEKTLETLEYIKSKWYKIAVVSNLSKDYAEPLYRLIPKWNFDYEILSFNVWAIKPDPEIYEKLKETSWIDFKDMIMVWDSFKSDVKWSYKVWIIPIHLNRSEKWIKEAHKWWIDFIQISTLDNLKEIL